MQAVVMAGGEGSRLRPLTINRPKPMVPIVDKPCLGHIFELLKRHGIEDSFVTLQYLATVIQDSYGDGGVVEFLENPSGGEVFSDTINTGIYVIEPRVLDRFGLGEVFDFSKDLFPRLLAEGEPLFGYVAEGYWTDVGSIAEYARANADLLRGKVQCDDLGHELMPGVWTAGDVDINESAKLTGPIFLGEGVKIGPHAEIVGPTVLRDYVSVDVGAIIDSSIVWWNTYSGGRSEPRGALV